MFIPRNQKPMIPPLVVKVPSALHGRGYIHIQHFMQIGEGHYTWLMFRERNLSKP